MGVLLYGEIKGDELQVRGEGRAKRLQIRQPFESKEPALGSRQVRGGRKNS